MPCHDITDTLKILLGHDDRLVKYALRKKTCGGEVGRKALIGKWLKNRLAEEIIATPIETVLEAHPTRSDVREFMVIKHFLAVKTGLEIMLGITPGGVKDYCKVASIEHGPEGDAAGCRSERPGDDRRDSGLRKLHQLRHRKVKMKDQFGRINASVDVECVTFCTIFGT